MFWNYNQFKENNFFGKKKIYLKGKLKIKKRKFNSFF